MSSPNLKQGFVELLYILRDLQNSPKNVICADLTRCGLYTKSFTRKTEAVNPVDKMCGPLAHFKPAFLSVYSKCPLGIENWVM